QAEQTSGGEDGQKARGEVTVAVAHDCTSKKNQRRKAVTRGWFPFSTQGRSPCRGGQPASTLKQGRTPCKSPVVARPKRALVSRRRTVGRGILARPFSAGLTSGRPL